MNAVDLNAPLKRLALEYIQRFHPDELGSFELVWEEVCLNPAPLPPPPKRWDRWLRYLPTRLGMGEGRGLPRNSLRVVLTLRLVMDECGKTAGAPTVEQLQVSLENAALRLGSGDEGMPRMLQTLAGGLEQALRHFRVPPQAGGPGTQPGSAEPRAFAHWLWGGREQRGWMSCDAAAVMGEEHPFDLVLDEAEHILIYRCAAGIKEADSARLPASQRGLLWLALTSVNQVVSYDAIAALLFRQRTLAEDRRDDNIHHYIKEMKKAAPFEACLRRVFTSVSGKAYRIEKRGWSFCWLRPRESPDSSELLQGLPGRPSENQ